jgi:hypothetical protein
MAEGWRCGNGRGRSGGGNGPDWQHNWTGHNRNFGHINWNLTGHNNARLNTDSGNDPAWNCKPDSRDRESNPRDGNPCPGDNARDNSNESHAGNESRQHDSANQPHKSDAGDNSG